LRLLGGAGTFVGLSTMVLDMERGRHPKVVRTWMADKLRKAASIQKRLLAVPHKPAPRNKA
jgi:hypothetical protein